MVITGILSSITSDVYVSEARVKVELNPENSASPSPSDELPDELRALIHDRAFLERLIEQFQMYGYGAKSNFSMDDAVRELQNQISIKRSSYDKVFIISSVAVDPEYSQMLTKQMTQELVRNKNENYIVKVVDDANFPFRQATPNWIRGWLMRLIFGCLLGGLGVCVALVWERISGGKKSRHTG